MQEFFLSVRRDIASCVDGTLVESIQGDQITKAVYTILPPEGTGRFYLFIIHRFSLFKMIHSLSILYGLH